MEKMKMIIAKKKKDILVRGIPKQLHEEIKKAAKEMTISEFMIKAAMNELSSVTGVQYSLSTEEYPDVKKTAAKRFKQKYLEKRIADLKANGKDSGILAGKLQLIENKSSLTFGQKARKPQITPIQLLILVIVEMMTMVEGILPLFFGEEFNYVWFIINFVINNVLYFIVMAMRGVMFAGKKPMELIQQIISNVIEILVNKDTSTDEKINRLTTLVKWIMEEINLYFEEQLKDFTEHMRQTYGDDMNDLLGFRFLPSEVLSPTAQFKEALITIQNTEKYIDPSFKEKLIKALQK